MSFMHSPGAFQTAIFPLGLRASEIAWNFEKFWEILRAHLSGADPRGWSIWCRTPASHSSRRSARLKRSLPTVGCYTRSGVFGKAMSLPLLSISVWSFHPLLWRSINLIFRSFSEGNDPYEAVDLLCPGEEVSSGPSYTSTLQISKDFCFEDKMSFNSTEIAVKSQTL